VQLRLRRNVNGKQRHTAHRIWTRLREEHAELPIAEVTVREESLKRAQGRIPGEFPAQKSRYRLLSSYGPWQNTA
jgi:hypothetical protein